MKNGMKFGERLAFLLGFQKMNEGQRKFQAAQYSRLNSTWATAESSINYDLRTDSKTLRARATDLHQNDSYVNKYTRMLARYVVGPEGFTHRNKGFKLIENAEGYKKQYYVKENYLINEAWNDFTRKGNCTVDAGVSFRGLTKTIVKAVAVKGEIFIKKVIGRQYKYGIALQAIDPSYVEESYNKVLPNGNRIIMGIEVDKALRPVAYHFKKIKPENEIYSTLTALEYDRVPADQVYHLYMVDFPGQLRGISWLASAAEKLRVFNGYVDAVLQNSRSGALKTMVLTPKDNAPSLNTGNVSGSQQTPDGNIQQHVYPNEIYVVPQGYEKEDYNPVFPQGEFGPFSEAILQGVASALDVDYPTLSSNFSNVNYTSSRSALLDIRAAYQDIQNFFIEQFLEPFRRDWLEIASFTKHLNIAPDLIDELNKPQFVGYRPEWVDPYKETNAAALSIEKNLDLLEWVLSQKGYDIDEFIAAKKEENEKLKAAGLLPSPIDTGKADKQFEQDEQEEEKTKNSKTAKDSKRSADGNKIHLINTVREVNA